MTIKTKDFRVKTNFIPRPNGHTQNAWEVGIDIGYSSVKAFAPTWNIQFPSFAELNNDQEIGTLKDDYIKYKNLVTGEEWLVGAQAQNSIDQDSTKYSDDSLYQRHRYDTPLFSVLVDVAIGLSMMKNEFGEPGDLPINIQTGLPSNYLKQDKGPLRQAFVGRHYFSLRVGNQKEETFDIEIPKTAIDIMEQPMGTLMSISIDGNHKFIPQAKQYLDSNILILDGGHGTWDTFEIANNRVASKKTFDEFSMRRVLEKTIEKIEDEYDTVISQVAIQKCLETGKFTKVNGRFSSEEIDFADILEEQSELMFEEMINHIAETHSFYKYNYIVITGGTGFAWANRIKEKLSEIKTIQFIDGNQNDTSLPFDFANARGYYMYLYQKNHNAFLQTQKSKNKS